MKNSETDKDFLDLVKNTLDNYEEQYILGSWENFVKARKRRKKVIFWRIGTGIAASLLIGWLGFRLIPSAPSTNAASAGHKSPEYSNPVILTAKDTLAKSVVTEQIPNENKETSLTSNAVSDRTAQSRSGELPAEGIRDINPGNTGKSNTSLKYNSEYKSESFTSELRDGQKLPDTLKAGGSLLPNLNTNNISENKTVGADSVEYKPLYTQSDTQATPEKDISNRSSGQKFRFGVNISPGVTSTATASSFNYSGGINADYALLPVLRLSTGLQFERLSVVNNLPSNDPALPQGETKAELLDLDIPLNITWKFLVRKSTSYYVSSGISSVVYLNEKYANTSYSQQMVAVVEVNDGRPNIGYEMQNVKTTEQTTEEPLNTFDFASRVNIIFGFEQHLSSKLFLNIEPYLKIPISEQASRNIKYSIGGISCKISF
ncbi:MAG: hypothetical protein IPN67_10190 [Bacteroidales bacterium]|nr:hypothetical protein [Bacteroidales bacterium]